MQKLVSHNPVGKVFRTPSNIAAELNMPTLKNAALAILSLKVYIHIFIFQYLRKLFLAEENHYNSDNFNEIFEIFFYMVSDQALQL